MERGCGILLPISSIPNKYGFGCFSLEAKEFVDYLSELGIKYWQILPLGPVDFVGSPYSSISSFAGDPLYIDLKTMLSDEQIESFGLTRDLSFPEYRKKKMQALHLCFDEYRERINYDDFVENNRKWLINYAVYMALSDELEVGYSKFPDEYKNNNSDETAAFILNHAREIEFYIFLQKIFFAQWNKIKTYANKKGIKIIGDIPIYCSLDSVEIYATKETFWLDNKGNPSYVAAVPGDYFNPDGQIWGNPLYDYNYLKKTKYEWWVDRFKHLSKIFDIIRIDHFRGLQAFYAVPYGDTTIKNGIWRQGPGMKFFETLYANGIKNLILEDLGVIDNAVIMLRKKTGLAGMRVMQFGFDGDTKNTNLPHFYDKNSVAYLGTHDNDTFMGFLSDSETRQRICRYFHLLDDTPKEQITKVAVDNLLSTNSDVCILTMQDILFEGSEYRINTPGTSEGNWIYKLRSDYKDSNFNKYLKDLIKLKNR